MRMSRLALFDAVARMEAQLVVGENEEAARLQLMAVTARFGATPAD